jgi:hypothetical protein
MFDHCAIFLLIAGYLYVGAGLSAPVRGWRARRKSAKTDAGFSKNLRSMLQDIDC